jgi:hypothetical protein
LSGASWRSLSYWSPHYHIIGLAAEVEANKPEEQDGWVFHRIRSLERFKLHEPDGYRDMVGVMMYVLSHASFESNSSRDCIRWFGSLSTAKFSPDDELSEGVLSVIERMARESAQSGPERAEEAAETDPCPNCGSTSRTPIWEAGYALSDAGWCERIGREQVRRLTVAFEWVIGERHPPPGLKKPRTEKEAREAFESML